MDIRMRFTEEESIILSNGILALIHNAGTAKTLVTDSNTQTAIDNEIEKLVALNNKVCDWAITKRAIYKYDFFEGDKGIVFAFSEEDAIEKVSHIYGSEYCECHKLEVKETEMWDVDVFCTESM